MLHKSQKSEDRTATELAFGPLRYGFYAEDTWGIETLQRLEQHVDCRNRSGTFDRHIHLSTDPPVDRAWPCRQNEIDTTWSSVDSDVAYWTASTSSAVGNVRFDLPWSLMINDMVSRGGGLVHAGLAQYEGCGYLFVAPPNGGKTTTLSMTPTGWTVLSDDAAFIWPHEGRWLASPLPAWGDLLRVDDPWPWPKMQLDASCSLKGICCLEKSERIDLNRLSPSQAASHAYRALSEYPVTIMTDSAPGEQIFRNAADLVRSLPVWRVELPRGGNFWPLLVREAA